MAHTSDKPSWGENATQPCGFDLRTCGQYARNHNHRTVTFVLLFISDVSYLVDNYTEKFLH